MEAGCYSASEWLKRYEIEQREAATPDENKQVDNQATSQNDGFTYDDFDSGRVFKFIVESFTDSYGRNMAARRLRHLADELGFEGFDQSFRLYEEVYSKHEASNCGSLKPTDFSDAGSRDMFCANYGETIRWTSGAGWYSYDDGDGIWKADEGTVMERVVRFSKDMLKEAQKQHIAAATALAKAQAEDADNTAKEKLAKDAKAAKSYLSFAQRQRNLYPLKSVLKLSESKLTMPDDAFDSNPNLLGVENGVLDLTTMELLPHDPSYLITKSFNAPHDPEADTEEVERFLDDIFYDDAEKKPYLLRIMGYALEGCPREDKAFIFHGESTRNGKTTLTSSMLFAFGALGTALHPDSLAVNRFADGSRARPDLIPLRGSRLVVVEEPTAEIQLDCALLKRLTGSSEIRARQLRREEIGFTMSGPLIIVCNNLPIVADRSVFDSGRLQVLPFARHFTESEIDTGLRDRLRSKKNRAAWLKPALKGLADYRENGLAPPLCVQAATDTYAGNSDVILRFLSDCTLIEPGVNTKGGDAFTVYTTWAIGSHIPPLPKSGFLAALRERNLLAKTGTVAGKTEYNVLKGRRLIS